METGFNEPTKRAKQMLHVLPGITTPAIALMVRRDYHATSNEPLVEGLGDSDLGRLCIALDGLQPISQCRVDRVRSLAGDTSEA